MEAPADPPVSPSPLFLCFNFALSRGIESLKLSFHGECMAYHPRARVLSSGRILSPAAVEGALHDSQGSSSRKGTGSILLGRRRQEQRPPAGGAGGAATQQTAAGRLFQGRGSKHGGISLFTSTREKKKVVDKGHSSRAGMKWKQSTERTKGRRKEWRGR